jgi:peptide/nickel transport system substrate-binding protein
MKEVNSFQQMYRDGRITRREFLSAMSALGLTATAAGGFLTSASALAATPTKGGTVIYANNMHGPDDQMDPIVFTSGIDYTRGVCTYNGLIQILDDMSLHAELAEEWTPNGDATEFTFKIRKGVTFHDGSDLTADDVVWSMNRHLGDDSASVVKSFFAAVTEWKKVDNYTVKVMLSSPDSDLPIKLRDGIVSSRRALHSCTKYQLLERGFLYRCDRMHGSHRPHCSSQCVDSRRR